MDLDRRRRRAPRGERRGCWAMEPRAEAGEVERDREFEAVEFLREPSRIALDRAGRGVADLERKGVGRAGDHEVQRRAPRGARGGSHQRSHVRAHGDVIAEAGDDAAGERRARLRGPVRMAHGARRAGERHRPARVVDAHLGVAALGERVVGGGYRDGEPWGSFGAQRPPAHVPLALVVVRLPGPDQGVRAEVPAHGERAAQAGGDREGGIVDHFMDRPGADGEAVHEVELDDAAVGHPGAAEVGRPVHQGLRMRWCGRKRY